MISVMLLAAGAFVGEPRAFEGERAVESDTTAVEPVTATTTTSTPATTTTTTTTTTATPAPTKDKAKPKRLPFPRLVIAGGLVLGPHTYGNEECRSEEARCETHGTFFGVGANVELRARIYKPLYIHLRSVVVGNAAPRDPVHRGLVGGGVGFGAYARRFFGRAEYLLVDTLGNDRFSRPFGDGRGGRDQWGHHAGLFSFGARFPFRQRLSAELWGGLMVGPRSTRSIPDEDDDRRTLLTFLAGINLAYDVIPARAH